MSEQTPTSGTETVTAVAPMVSAEILADETALNPDKALVAKIKSDIDLTDRAHLISFGDSAQREVAAFADRILSETLNKDTGPVGNLLSDMMIKVKGLDPKSLEKLGFFERIFGGVKAKMERFKSQFTNVAAQIDRIALELQSQQETLKRDIAMLDGLHAKNLEQMQTLEAFIVAGTQYVEEARKETIPAMEARLQEVGDGAEGQLAAQQLNDARQALERLDKKIHDLKLSRVIALQALPQIRLVQSGNATLVEKLQSSVATTIPTWKNQMTIALAIHRQREALELQKNVSEATNQMLKDNAERLRAGTVEVERESQRGVVDIATLSKVNEELIGTINDVLRIQEEGRQQRAAAEQEMKRIEVELKDTLAQAAAKQAES
ncbi:MAG: toxic anion resistance protein [Pseudomonadota bacterium]